MPILINGKSRLGLALFLLISVISLGNAATPTRVVEFQAMTAWTLDTGTPKILAHVTHLLDFPESTMQVRAQVFDEQPANIRHAFCVGTPPQAEKFRFFIETDLGDKTATIWQVSPKGELVATLCYAGGAIKTAPNADFQTGFLVEREYFLRTFRHLKPPPDLIVNPPDAK